MRPRLLLRFAGAAPRELVERALAAGVVPATAPSWMRINYKEGMDARPLPTLAHLCDDLSVVWDKEDKASLGRSRKHDEVRLRREPWPANAEAMLALIADWPFEACTTGQLHPWGTYRSVHGWGFFLKGAGHRLVSPRIRDRGPWRTLRDDARDVTLFQFHDLAADEATALAQAQPGHTLLKPVWSGGHYMSQAWVFRGSADAYKPTFYDPATRTSIVLVQDREVAADEMGVAAGTKVHSIFPQPVDQVAFVFLDEATGRRQLPALWLYGLEVRVMTAQGERRIDTDYEPPPLPEPPEWVRRLEAGQAPGSPP
jgi:hypothetical protein